MSVITTLNNGSISQASVIAAQLTGWSASEKSQVQSWINNATKVDLDDAAVSSVVSLAQGDTTTEVTNLLSQKVSTEIEEKERALRDAYIVQDAKGELKQNDAISPNSSTAHNLPQASFSLTEDNDESYGFVDSVKNWFKINKKKKTVEAFFANGVLVRADGQGNVSVACPGSFKHVVGGNYVLDVKGTMETYVGGKLVHKVGGSVTETYGSSHNTTVSGVRSEKASQIHHN